MGETQELREALTKAREGEREALRERERLANELARILAPVDVEGEVTALVEKHKWAERRIAEADTRAIATPLVAEKARLQREVVHMRAVAEGIAQGNKRLVQQVEILHAEIARLTAQRDETLEEARQATNQISDMHREIARLKSGPSGEAWENLRRAVGAHHRAEGPWHEVVAAFEALDALAAVSQEPSAPTAGGPEHMGCEHDYDALAAEVKASSPRQSRTRAPCAEKDRPMKQSEVNTIDDVARWLRYYVEWTDEASRDMASRAVDVLSKSTPPLTDERGYPYLIHPDELRRACIAANVRPDIMFALIGREQRERPDYGSQEPSALSAKSAVAERAERFATMFSAGEGRGLSLDEEREIAWMLRAFADSMAAAQSLTAERGREVDRVVNMALDRRGEHISDSLRWAVEEALRAAAGELGRPTDIRSEIGAWLRGDDAARLWAEQEDDAAGLRALAARVESWAGGELGRPEPSPCCPTCGDSHPGVPCAAVDSPTPEPLTEAEARAWSYDVAGKGMPLTHFIALALLAANRGEIPPEVRPTTTEGDKP